MKCPICEFEMEKDEIKCPDCGALIKRKKVLTNKKKTIIFSIAIITVIAVVVTGLYFFTDLFGKNSDGILNSVANQNDNVAVNKNGDTRYLCGICGSELTNKSDFCLSCKEKYTCIDCGVIEESVRDSFCKSCKEKSKVRCEKCYLELDSADDDKICFQCAQYYCHECNEVLEESEISATGQYGVFCELCNTGKQCSVCGNMLNSDDDDTVCNLHAKYCCYMCQEVLEKREIAGYGKINRELVYCKDCESGFFCKICGLIVGEGEEICPACS